MGTLNNYHKIIFNKKYYMYIIIIILIVIVVLMSIDAFYGNTNINNKINSYRVDANENEELYAVDTFKKNLNKHHKKLTLKEALTEVNPKPNYHSSYIRLQLSLWTKYNIHDNPSQFLRLSNQYISNEVKLKSKKKDNLIDSYDLIMFFVILICLLIISALFISDRVKLDYYHIQHSPNILGIVSPKSLKGTLRYIIGRNCVNKILYHYVYLVLPVIIAVSGGSFDSLDDGNYFNSTLLFLISISAGVFAFIQFVKIYRGYMYDINSDNKVVNFDDARIENSIYKYVKSK